MAVSPALTYPSKTLKSRAVTSWLRIACLLPKHKLFASIPSFSDGTFPPGGHMLAPRLMYRSVRIEFKANPSARVVAFQAVRRSVLTMNYGVIRMRGFPIPYLSRVTTRPPYGEQWPRFAVFGSTM